MSHVFIIYLRYNGILAISLLLRIASVLRESLIAKARLSKEIQAHLSQNKEN